MYPGCTSQYYFNTPFAFKGASVLYVELVHIQSADNSSFRLYGLYDTPLDAARAQTEDGRKKIVQSLLGCCGMRGCGMAPLRGA